MGIKPFSLQFSKIKNKKTIIIILILGIILLLIPPVSNENKEEKFQNCITFTYKKTKKAYEGVRTPGKQSRIKMNN